MAKMEMLYKFIDSLKWVLVLTGFILYFRSELRERLKNGFSICHGQTKIDFPQPEQNLVEKRNNREIEEIAVNKTKDELQKLYNDNKDKDNQIFRLKLEKNFEYTYRIIFKSQITLLNSLQAITDGLPLLQIEHYLMNIKKAFPILGNSTVERYLKFLYDQNLIEKDLITGKIKLTPIGDLFLKYMVINQYNYEIEKNL